MLVLMIVIPNVLMMFFAISFYIFLPFLIRCPVCSRDFTQNVHLKVHMRKHTGNRPFQCSRCQKGFIDSTALAKHVENEACHSENFVFHCRLCDKRHYYRLVTSDFFLNKLSLNNFLIAVTIL